MSDALNGGHDRKKVTLTPFFTRLFARALSRSPFLALIFLAAIMLIAPSSTKAWPSNSESVASEVRPTERKMEAIKINNSLSNVDIKGSGENEDILITTYKETGSAYSPTIYILMTKNPNDSAHPYHLVSVPNIYTGSYSSGGFVIDVYSMNCFDVKSSFFYEITESKSNVFTVVVAKRSTPFGEANITVDVFQPSQDKNTMDFVLTKMNTVSVTSSACSTEELGDLEQRLLGAHFKE